MTQVPEPYTPFGYLRNVNIHFFHCRENVSDYGKDVIDLKERVFEIIEELLMELETASDEIRYGKEDLSFKYN